MQNKKALIVIGVLIIIAIGVTFINKYIIDKNVAVSNEEVVLDTEPTTALVNSDSSMDETTNSTEETLKESVGTTESNTDVTTESQNSSEQVASQDKAAMIEGFDSIDSYYESSDGNLNDNTTQSQENTNATGNSEETNDIVGIGDITESNSIGDTKLSNNEFAFYGLGTVYRNSKSPKVALSNLEENSLAVKCVIKDSSGKSLFSSEYLSPGQTAYWDATKTYSAGTYNLTLVYNYCTNDSNHSALGSSEDNFTLVMK